MTRVESEAFFLPSKSGYARFCLHHAPEQENRPEVTRQPAVKALVVFLPAWADEMNKSRRMVRMQARLLASSGFAVLQVDLTGCGDSQGDHGDATWEQWVEDGMDAVSWLKGKYRDQRRDLPVILWGLRSGCLLARVISDQLDEVPKLLLWNPPASGRVLWQQFFRLATAAALTSDLGKARAEEVKRRAQDGLALEIAGYNVQPALAKGLESATMGPPSRPSAVALIDTGSMDGDEVSPALVAVANKWLEAGHAVASTRVQGPAFWQTTEIEDAPLLLSATLGAAERLISDSSLAGV